MVLERLFRTKDLLASPILLVVYTIIVAVVGMITAYFFFPNSASLVAIGFMTIALTHFFQSTYIRTERAEDKDFSGFFQKYSMVIRAYVKMFLALVVVFALIYALVPQDVRLLIFSEQIDALKGVGQLRTSLIATAGNFSLTSAEGGLNVILYILFNNIEVLLAILLLSFLYGAGAIFLIAYQSSILGAIIGENILNLFGHYTNLGAYGQIFAILHGSYNSLGVLPHGVFEIGAYFLGAVAGGIISATLTGHYAQSKQHLFDTVRDVLILVILAVVFLVLGALIETYLLLA